MRKLAILAALLIPALFLLAGCGSDPTPTIPAQATATATSAPANTVTATSATVTTVDATPASTATDATPAASQTITATNTGPNAGSWADALNKMESLTSYYEHRLSNNNLGMDGSQALIEGFIIPPDRSYITLTTTLNKAVAVVQVISIGQDIWAKSDSTNQKWEKSAGTAPNVTSFEFSNSTGFKDVTVIGEEVMNGLRTRHYSFTMTATDPATQLVSSSAGEAWVSIDSGYILRLAIRTTQTDGTDVIEADTITDYDHFNNPNIKIEPPT